MTTENTNIYNWMQDIVDKKPDTFAEHFYSDIFDYVFPDNFDDIAEFADKELFSGLMRSKLLKCSSKAEVKNWMDDVAGNIIMKIDTEQIISDALN